MQVSKETRLFNIICVVLVLLAGVIRMAAKQTKAFSYNSIIFVLFMAAAAIWIFQLQKRLLQTDVRRNLIGAVLLMIFWIAVRTIKYDFLPPNHFTARYAWYLYYLPMLFIPLLMLLSVLGMGLPYNRTISPWWYTLFIPSTVIFFGVMTNDIHQMAFCFGKGLDLWDSYPTTRGFVYYGAMVWIGLLFIAMLSVVFTRCAVPGRRKMIWIPLIPLVIGVIYTICVIFDADNLITKMLRAPEVGCVVFAAFMECLICVGLFPTNDNYGVFWNCSSIGAGIMDYKGVVRYKSQKSFSVTAEQVKKAEQEPVFLNEGNIRLKSHAVHGGWGYWLRDISEINRLNDRLKEMSRVTAEENSVLEAENKIKAERLRVQEQNKLYDHIAQGVKKQIDILNGLLDCPPEDEAVFEEMMKYACILNAYIKRHSNLVLLSHTGEFIYSGELSCAFNESVEYIKLCGIKIKCFFDGEGDLPCNIAVTAYEVFEYVAEASVPQADNMLVYLKISKECLLMQMEVNAPREIISETVLNEKTAALCGTIEVETEENTEYVTLILPFGGEKCD